MKGKLPIILSALIALVTVLGLVAAVVPTVASAATTTTTPNVISPVGMPTQGNSLLLDSGFTALSQAADGTLFAGVQDTSDYLRWPQLVNGTDVNRDYAVFTSSDGSHWNQGFIIPNDDDNPMLAIVPVPDYSSNYSWVYMITANYVYQSTDGGKTFSRLAVVPGTTAATGNASITSIAVTGSAGNYIVAVSTTSSDDGGVFAYNLYGVPMWTDMQIGNQAYGAGYSVYAVKFSTNYATDKVMLAVANDGSDTILTVRGTLGTWNVETPDAVIVSGTVPSAKIVLPADYNWISNPVSYVVADGVVYQVTSTQTPVAKDIADSSKLSGGETPKDLVVTGSGSSTSAMLATTYGRGMSGDVQVYSCSNVAGFSPVWTPSYKQPIGGYGAVKLVTGKTGTFVATNGEGPTPSGISKLVQCAQGMAWNGVGLIDMEVSTGTYLGNSSNGGPVWVDASPNNNVDNTIFMVTYSEERSDAVWRSADGGNTWDLICVGNLQMGDGNMDEAYDALSDQVIDPANIAYIPGLITVQTAPTFSNTANSTDEIVYMLAQDISKTDDPIWIFQSKDAGNTWKPIASMPNAYILSLTAWCVVNDNTILLSDNQGYVYKTTDGGYTWTSGAVTAGDCTITSLKFLNASTGLVVLAGVSIPETNTTSTAEVFISLDGGNSFNAVGTSLGTFTTNENTTIVPVMVDFDNNWNTNHIVYAAFGGYFDTWSSDYLAINGTDINWTKTFQGEAGVWRSSVSTTDPTSGSLWTTIVSTADLEAMVPAASAGAATVTYETRDLYPTGLEVGPSDTLYIPFVFYDEATGQNTWGGFIRCLDGTVAATKWTFVSSSLPGYGALLTADVVNPSNLFTIGYRYDAPNSDIYLKLLTYADVFASPVSIITPANGATGVGVISGNSANEVLTWTNVASATYNWQIDLDSTFDQPISGTATAAMATVSGLQLGTTYYCRVQTANGPWSTVSSFTTVSTVSGAPVLTSPINGATITDTKPLLAWNPVTGATSYSVTVATDATFTAITEQATVTTNSYATPTTLANGVYYWKVTATVGSTTTAPGNSVFQITSASTTSSTPAWVWVLIVLGIVLAIFVLVLILRTRRPV